MRDDEVNRGLADRHPIAAAVAFIAAADLIASFLKATIVASLDEHFPLTLALFLATAALLRWALGPRAAAALGLTLILLSPLFLRPAPYLSALSRSSNFLCEGYDNTLTRIVTVVFFPLDPAYIALWALPAAIAAWLLVPRLRWPAIGPILRWSAVAAGLAAAIALLRSAGRIDAGDYLQSRPVVAVLFPTSEPFAREPTSQEPGEYALLEIGPLRVHRRCRSAGSASCVVSFEEERAIEVGCLDSNTRVVLRRDDALDIWLVDDGHRRFAFRREEADSPRLAWRDLTRADLLPFTRPPTGWLLAPALGVAAAVIAGLRRRPRESAGIERLARDLCVTAAVILSLLAVAPWLRLALAAR